MLQSTGKWLVNFIQNSKFPRAIHLLEASVMRDVQLWFNHNKLHLNTSKTSYMYFGPGRVPSSDILPLRICGSSLTINPADEVKFLGLMLDERMRWRPHLQALSSRLASAVFALKSIRENVDCSTSLTAYFAYFHSILSYAIPFWGFAAGVRDIFLLQKKAIRAVFNITIRTSCRRYFRDYNILTLYAQLTLDSCLNIHKLADILPKHVNIHNHNTRNKSNIIKSNPKLIGHSFLNEGVHLYNLLPPSFKDLNHDRLRTILKTKLIESAPYTLDECISSLHGL